MSLADEMVDALKARENDVSATVTISGTSYACSASAFKTAKMLEVGGELIEYDLSVSIRRALFGSIPASKTKATFNGKAIRIQDVVEPPGSAFIRLLCSSDVKGM